MKLHSRRALRRQRLAHRSTHRRPGTRRVPRHALKDRSVLIAGTRQQDRLTAVIYELVSTHDDQVTVRRLPGHTRNQIPVLVWRGPQFDPVPSPHHPQ